MLKKQNWNQNIRDFGNGKEKITVERIPRKNQSSRVSIIGSTLFMIRYPNADMLEMVDLEN